MISNGVHSGLNLYADILFFPGKWYIFRELNYRNACSATKFQLGTYNKKEISVCQQASLEIFPFYLISLKPAGFELSCRAKQIYFVDYLRLTFYYCCRKPKFRELKL